jgi:hypothetical protein
LIISIISYPFKFVFSTLLHAPRVYILVIGNYFISSTSLKSILSCSFFYSSLLFLFPVVRVILGTLNVLAFSRFRHAVQKEFGHFTGVALILLTLSQFHLCFYMSRTLPNTFALALVLFGFANWIERYAISSYVYFTLVIVIFRSEVALLFAPLVFDCVFISKQISVPKTIIYGIIITLCSMLLTISIDSYFWHRFLWPEGSLLWFNTIENKSHMWGVSCCLFVCLFVCLFILCSFALFSFLTVFCFHFDHYFSFSLLSSSFFLRHRPFIGISLLQFQKH